MKVKEKIDLKDMLKISKYIVLAHEMIAKLKKNLTRAMVSLAPSYKM